MGAENERKLVELLCGQTELPFPDQYLKITEERFSQTGFEILDGDLCSLIRFRGTLRRWPEETYVLHCCREQIVYLKEYLGDYSGKGNLKLSLYAPETLRTHLQKA